MTTVAAPTPPATPAPVAARLRPADMARLAAVGLRTRKLRASLSALRIAIGVAAITAVLGLSASSQAGLLAEIARLGTNLLTVQNGQTLTGDTAELPVTAPGMISRLPGVTQVQDTGAVDNVNAFRSPLIPAGDTNALTVDATSLGLPATVGTPLAQQAHHRVAGERVEGTGRLVGQQQRPAPRDRPGDRYLLLFTPG
jgi:putative ABC transport system permease protein